MAAGAILLDVKDGDGVIRTVKFWSSDGTAAGTLQAMGYIADGDLISLGAVADAAVSNPASSGSVIAISKGQLSLAGSLTETAPATDTASSGLNGRLQRIAQRLTTILTGIVLAAGTAIIGKVGIDQTTPGTTNGVQVNAALPAGTNTIGGVFQVPQTAGNGPALISYAAITNTVTAAGTSAAHNLLGWSVGNLANAAVSYVQVFNLATGSVTLGTTPPLFVIPIPANGGSNLSLQFPVGFSTAISYAVTTTATGSTAPGAACNVTFFYI